MTVSVNCISLSRAFALCWKRCLPVPKCCSPCARGSPPFHLCPAYSFFPSSWNRVGQGHGNPSLPSPQLLWADLTSCREILFVHCFFGMCPQGGGHDLHISQPAPKINIKTRIIGGSGNGTEMEGRKQEAKATTRKFLVVKNILSVVCHLSCCFPHHSCSPALSSTEI